MSLPEKIQVSTAAAMALGLKRGIFYRGAKLHCLNLLMTYEDGCKANCSYCGLSRSRRKSDTFIRVAWPICPLDEVLKRAKGCAGIERVCVAMVTHPEATEDAVDVIKAVKDNTPFLVSALIAPTLIKKQDLQAMKSAGANRAGVSVDAATEKLFDALRGKGVKGPHKWQRYWDTLQDAVEVFGSGMAGVHLIVGLGETEREMVSCIQRAQDMGSPTHLFSFFPERGSRDEMRSQPPIGVYRRMQLARYLINSERSSFPSMSFDEKGVLTGFGISDKQLEDIIGCGLPFRTSGCPGKDSCISACNRPYGNERPSEAIRNFPFAPSEQDIADIRSQLSMEV